LLSEKLFEKNLRKDDTDNAVAIVLNERQNLNFKILIIKLNFCCYVSGEAEVIAKEQN